MNAFRIPTPRDRAVDRARQIISDTARAAGFDLALLRCSARRLDLVEVRYEAAAAAYLETEAPLIEIARILNRNHSTVLHGLRQLGVAG